MSGEPLAERIHAIRCGCDVGPAKVDRDAALAAHHHRPLLAAIQQAGRLRSLAAIYEQPLNRDTTFTFTGRELAAMLKEER